MALYWFYHKWVQERNEGQKTDGPTQLRTPTTQAHSLGAIVSPCAKDRGCDLDDEGEKDGRVLVCV